MRYYARQNRGTYKVCLNCFRQQWCYRVVFAPRLSTVVLISAADYKPEFKDRELCRDCIERLSETRAVLDRH